MDHLAEDSSMSPEISSLQECPPEAARSSTCASHSQSLQTREAFKMQAMSRSSQTAIENEACWLFTGWVMMALEKLIMECLGTNTDDQER